MALIDMYEVVHEMTLLGKTILNVFHCERANAGEVAGSISDGWQNSVLPSIRAWQDSGVSNIELRIFNLGNPLDFGTFSLTGAPGLRTGESSPTFVSAGIRFPTLNREIRSGFKRFSGSQESDYFEGVLAGSAITLLTTLATALIGNWLASSDSHIVANYVIIKRVCKTVDPVSGKCLVYRLPETDLELKFFTPGSFVIPTEITSQVSRKIR